MGTGFVTLLNSFLENFSISVQNLKLPRSCCDLGIFLNDSPCRTDTAPFKGEKIAADNRKTFREIAQQAATNKTTGFAGCGKNSKKKGNNINKMKEKKLALVKC